MMIKWIHKIQYNFTMQIKYFNNVNKYSAAYIDDNNMEMYCRRDMWKSLKCIVAKCKVDQCQIWSQVKIVEIFKRKL